MTDAPESALDRATVRLGRAELVPVVDELARRLARAADATPARLTLRGLPLESRRALADLLGSDRLPAPQASLSVARLSAALGLSAGASLRPVVERLRGPLADRHAQQAADQQARVDLWTWLAEQVAFIDLGTGCNHLAAWVADQRAAGARGGVAAYRVRLDAVLRILRALPVDGQSLAAFASDLTSNPHAFDPGRPLTGFVLGAIAAALGQPSPSDAESVRVLWESVGVVPDPVSSNVLSLGLPGHAAPPLGSWLAAARSAGEPVVLTLANLRRWPVPPLRRGASLFVVENPSLVIEAAARLWDGPPIVCSSGRPSVAVMTLLRQLTADGATALQHADFDPAGLSITAWLADRAGTTPWRMSAADYRRAATGAANVTGPIPETPWDPTLRAAMAQIRVSVYEEQVRAELLAAMREPEVGGFGLNRQPGA